MRLRIARKILRREAYCRRERGRLVCGSDGPPPKSYHYPRYRQLLAALDRWVKWKCHDPNYRSAGHYYDTLLPKRCGAEILKEIPCKS